MTPSRAHFWYVSRNYLGSGIERVNIKLDVGAQRGPSRTNIKRFRAYFRGHGSDIQLFCDSSKQHD
jgi:hypothetical protein